MKYLNDNLENSDFSVTKNKIKIVAASSEFKFIISI